MKVNAIKCDCVDCNNVSDIMNVVTINGKTYDICNEHSKLLNKLFNLGMRTEQPTEQTVEKEKPTVEKEEKTEKEVKQTKKEEVQTEQTKQKARKKGDYTTLIEQYGVDRLKTEYIDNNKSANEIAMSIGIPKTALSHYIFKHNISKRTKKNDDSTKSDKEGVWVSTKAEKDNKTVEKVSKTVEKDSKTVEKDNKTKADVKVVLKDSDATKDLDDCHIDKIRTSKRRVRIIESLEKTCKIDTKKCLDCIYRDKDIGMCYYTVVTNKYNKVDNECHHFVEKSKALRALGIHKA